MVSRRGKRRGCDSMPRFWSTPEQEKLSLTETRSPCPRRSRNPMRQEQNVLAKFVRCCEDVGRETSSNVARIARQVTPKQIDPLPWRKTRNRREIDGHQTSFVSLTSVADDSTFASVVPSFPRRRLFPASWSTPPPLATLSPWGPWARPDTCWSLLDVSVRAKVSSPSGTDGFLTSASHTTSQECHRRSRRSRPKLETFSVFDLYFLKEHKILRL